MTITEVSRKYEISPDTLRYYERIGLIPAVGRTAGGIRNYTEEDCNWVEFIKCMRSAGLAIESLAEYVALFQQGSSTLEARKRLLTKQRGRLSARIQEMQATLERLDRKIDQYEQWSSSFEKKVQKAPAKR